MHVRYLSDYAMNYLALERKRPMQTSGSSSCSASNDSGSGGEPEGAGRVGWDLLTKDEEEDSRAKRLPSTLPGVYILRIQHNLRDAARTYHLAKYFISQHISTTKHKNALSKATGKKNSLPPTVIATSQFAFDLCKAFLATEIPLWKVQGCGSSARFL
ncbi:hypothetical protein ANN_22041 [Periplaneta americana]|uniref:Uncharacterized protein n=1 Tax=Periplaneta americana TaxID=6978 RepID=A0ABQ8S709_PERAM|nr:hypothetical protein ANN_22041 [Periplaneta americana]